MSRPLIGVTASARRGRVMGWFNRLALWRAGARVRRLTAESAVSVAELDGLVIGGGDDIDAGLYGLATHDPAATDPTVRIDPARDRLELRLLQAAEERRLPVLGICRGAQMVNVQRGGSLHGDIYEAYPGTRRRRTVLPVKDVTLAPDSRLRRILGRVGCRVNALHHQSVDRPGRGVVPVARDGDAIVQAVEVPNHPFLIGVQWHPEFLVFDRAQQRLFRTLVEAAMARRQERALDAAA